MTPIQKLIAECLELQQRLGYTFSNPQFLVLAFIHRSFFNEHRHLVSEHNERLEFLGDSVLGVIISDYLYAHLPTHAEGDLSQYRSSIVDAAACSAYLQKLNIAEFILLGRGEKMNDGKGRETVFEHIEKFVF